MGNKKVKCLEAKYHLKNARNYIILDIVFFLIIGSIFFLFYGFSKKTLSTILTSLMIENIVLLTFIIYEFYKYFYIKKRVKYMDRYIVQFGEKQWPFSTRYSGLCFSVFFEMENGDRVKKDTKKMFYFNKLNTFNIFDSSLYENKMMEVAYDYEKDEIIVIGLAKESNLIK